MKTNISNYTILKTASIMACLLTVTACADTSRKSSPASAIDYKSNLDDTVNGNNNPLLPPSVYESNHLTDS